MAGYGCLTVDQRTTVVVLFAEIKGIYHHTRRLWTIFRTWWAPERNTILCFFKKFEEEGECEGRVCMLQMCGLLKLCKQPWQISKERSSSVWKISSLGTNNTLKVFENLPYKIAAVNNLSDNDKVRWLQFPTWAAGEHEILFNVRFSDKVCFHLDGIVSKSNVWFWWMESPENFHGKSSHCFGCHVQPQLNRPNLFEQNRKLCDICIYCRTTSCHNWQHIALASAYTVVYGRWCHIAYCIFYARFEHCFWPSHHVKPLSGSAQLWKLLVTCLPWPESLRLIFVGLLEGVCTKTIH